MRDHDTIGTSKAEKQWMNLAKVYGKP